MARQVRWGMTIPFLGLPLPEQRELVQQVEAAGYDDLWSAETSGPDGFTPLALAAVWTERVRLATGIVGVFTRGRALLAQQAAALQEASNGRFVLGIGSSSDVIVERWNGIPFSKPLSKVRETVEALRPILAGERGPGGFKLDAPPATPVPIYLAALRPRMLELSGEIGDGTFLNFVPASAAPRLVGHVREGERRAGKAEGSNDIAMRLFCFPGPEEQTIGTARFLFCSYATVPVYEQFFRWLGLGDRIDAMVTAWRERDRQKALELVPDDLLREIFLLGPLDAQREQALRFSEGGVKTLVVTPVCAPSEISAFIDAFSPA
jgi:probable F420-dependent oxidoreductase